MKSVKESNGKFKCKNTVRMWTRGHDILFLLHIKADYNLSQQFQRLFKKKMCITNIICIVFLCSVFKNKILIRRIFYLDK